VIVTSGIFHSVDVDAITVLREERQRRELNGIDELADSISRVGLIHPIVVTRDSILVAGERRLAAVRNLGWTHIPAQFAEELTPLELRVIELEENTKRLDITWQEHCRAVNEYHMLMKVQRPGWVLEDTAKALGIVKSEVSHKIAIANELLTNAKIADAPTYSIAKGMALRANERRASDVVGRIMETEGVQEIEEVPTGGSSFQPVLHVDFIEWAAAYRGPRFNFIHCDFPYGVNIQDRKYNFYATKHERGTYDDDEQTYWELVRALIDNLDRLAEPQCHLMFWFSMPYYQQTIEVLGPHFDISPFPLIWVKSDNAGILPDPSRGPRRIYETCLFGSRGDRKIVQAVSNAIAAPTSREFHMSEKPIPVLRQFFRMFVDGSSRVLDPTAGSGGALLVAKELGATALTGIELDADFVERANGRFE
jgi:ParB/RepB/Spo0J family partition protein